MSALAATAEHPTAGRMPEWEPAGGHAPNDAAEPSGPRERAALAAATLLIAGLLCFATFEAGGGLQLEPMTIVELSLTLGAGAIAAGALLIAPRGARAYGAWPTALLLAMTALSAASIAWSVAPDSSWQDAGRMLAFSALFGAAVALARAAPRGWPALLGGVALSSAIVCGYALATKIFPGHLDSGEVYARLQEPYGYWNAIGLTAALGAAAFMWLGARRAGHGLLSAMAYPGMGLALVTLMLAYSRGAIVALIVGLALWFVIVPLRLRGAFVLIVGALGAAPVVAWDFSEHALSSDNVALAARASAGHQLGVLVAAMLVALTALGVAVGFFRARRAPRMTSRRRAGAILIGMLVLALIGGAGGLEASKRGFTGTISHAFKSLTDPNAPVPANTPGRLTAVGSVRARYWKEALDAFRSKPALGVGAGGYETARLRYRKETLDVKHAHGYIVQTLADLGIAGLAISLALLAAWLAVAARATRPLNRRLGLQSERRAFAGLSVPTSLRLSWRRAPAPYTPERIGLSSMVCVVVVFGVHSFADWTWYVPGNACVALLCAGWLAGRGPLRDESDTAAEAPTVIRSGPNANGRHVATGWRWPRARRDPQTLLTAGLVLAGALLAAWTQWQPQHSAEESERALGLLVHDPAAARAEAQAGVAHDPLSAQALFTLSAVQHASGDSAEARATLQKAVRLQPSNPQTWLTLGQYDRTADPKAAVDELRAAVYLDPRSIATQNAYVEALRASGAASAGGTTPGTGAAPSGSTRHGRGPTGGVAPSTESPAQNRRRNARTSSARRAPGTPPARSTRTS